MDSAARSTPWSSSAADNHNSSSSSSSSSSDSARTSSRDVHGQLADTDVDVDRVCSQGDMYVQGDGQVVRVLDNGNGTGDVVVRDPSNPSGQPTTKIENMPNNQVQARLEDGRGTTSVTETLLRCCFCGLDTTPEDYVELTLRIPGSPARQSFGAHRSHLAQRPAPGFVIDLEPVDDGPTH